MALTPNGFGLFGLVTGTLVLALAAFVYRARPERTQNRRLALLLAAEGIMTFTGTGLMFLVTSARDAFAIQGISVMILLAVPFLYLRFIGTLDSPLATPLRHPVLDRALIGGSVVAPCLWLVMPKTFVAGLVDVWFVPWELLPGPGWLFMFQVNAVVYLYGFVAALSAYFRAAPGSLQRRQGRLLAIAIGWRDITFSFLLIGPIFITGLTYDTQYGGLFWAGGPQTTQIVFVPLLAYAILKSQLFDIDLKIKLAVQRSTVAATFAVAFFVTSELVESVLAINGTLAGVAAAGAVALGLRPLQRFAHRFASAAMPQVEDTEAYRTVRKQEVYAAAVVSALQDGQVSDMERAVLRTLAEQLSLTADEAGRIEARALTDSPSPAP